MSDRPRLVQCFLSVFPNLSEGDVPNATMDSVEGWDSIATVTLIAVVQEEMGVQIPPDQFKNVTSFEGLATVVERAPKKR